MSTNKTIDGVWAVEETTELSSLTITEGASVKAPEGKYVILTVDGIGRTIAPGTYEGNVVLSVADEFERETYRFGKAEMNKFRAGIFVKDGKYLPGHSVPAIVRGGKVGDGVTDGVTINSREWDFNGFYVTGEGEYNINDVNITLVGDGTDDFCGLGAGIAVSGKAKVTVNNAEIHSFGISRGAAFVGEDSEVTFNDCFFTLDSGTWTPQELDERRAGEKFRMMEPPWVMGITGYGRTTNLAGMATSNYNRCHVISNSWGVLSVDGGCVTRMNVKDSLLELTGESGYGVFSIADDMAFDYKSFGKHGSYDVFDHSIVKGVTYPIIMSLGKSGGAFINGSEVYARFGCLIFRNDGGHLDINNKTVFNTELSTFIVKGANSYIDVDDAILNPGNGVILNLMDNDETGMGGDNFVVPRNVVDEKIPGRDLTVAVETEDVFVSISNMEVKGDFFNSTTNTFPNLVKEDGAPEEDEKPPMDGQVRGMGADLQGAKNLDIKFKNAEVTGLITAAKGEYPEGLKIISKKNYKDLSVINCTASRPVNNGVIASFDKDCVWTVPGTCYLTKLIVEAGAVLKAPEGGNLTMTVDDVKTDIAPGIYVGDIVLTAG